MLRFGDGGHDRSDESTRAREVCVALLLNASSLADIGKAYEPARFFSGLANDAVRRRMFELLVDIALVVDSLLVNGVRNG